MNNIAIIRQGTGRYLFSVPDNVSLKQGDRVKCDTRRGITDGIAFADSAWVDENVSQLIGKLTGAKFPLKPVVGKMEYQPFEKPEDKPAANPANKYEGMSNTQLKIAMCTRGSCHVCNDGRRKHDCLFADNFGCPPVTAANRAEVIEYLLAEDAEEAPKPQDKPAANPANKYEGMSNKELDFEMCVKKGACSAIHSSHRKNDCPLRGMESCDITAANRAEVIEYLLAEDAEAAPKPEGKPTEYKRVPIKLYCVKDYRSGSTLTGGKTYDFVDGRIKYDRGQNSSWHANAKELCEAINENTETDLIFPLVARPAKVGEWVLLDSDDCFGKNKKGDAVNVVSAPAYTTTFCFISDPTREYSGGICVCFERDYTYVLDGYQPEPEAEKEPEPEYYSGKVVCVESKDRDFAVGKMYEFVNGQVKDGMGDERPMLASQRFKSVDEWNEAFGGPIARFIEYKGEAK